MGTVLCDLTKFEQVINEAVLKRLEENLDDIPVNASFEEAWTVLMDNCPEFQTVTTFRL